MKKNLAAIAAVAVALSGCGGDDGAKETVGAATLTQTGAAWGKLTPVQKKTVVAYCLPPTALDVSPTRVVGAINRLYAGPAGAATKIRTACTRAVSELRTDVRVPTKGDGKRVARASKALLEFCPDDPQFLLPKKVATLTGKLAVAYEQSPNRRKDRKYVVGAIAKLDAGCGPSARLKKALQAAPGGTTQSAAKRGARMLTGNGPRELGDLAVSKNSDLRWTRGGESAYFSVTEEQGRLSFLSEAPRGYRVVPKGTYRDVWVDTDGPWTIVITPRYPSPPPT